MPRTKFSELRKELDGRPGATERIAKEKAEVLEEIRLAAHRSAGGEDRNPPDSASSTDYALRPDDVDCGCRHGTGT